VDKMQKKIIGLLLVFGLLTITLGCSTGPSQAGLQDEPMTNTPSRLTGNGDDVVSFNATGSGMRIFTIQYKDTSGYFSVWLKDAQGKDVSLLVTNIGQYSGKKSQRLTPVKYYLEVSAKGSWTIEIQ